MRRLIVFFAALMLLITPAIAEEAVLHGRNITLPEGWHEVTAGETYIKCLSPAGVIELHFIDYESETDALVAMNMGSERAYMRHEEQLRNYYGAELMEQEDTLLERIEISGYIPAVRYAVNTGDGWYSGIVFYNDCEQALVQLHTDQHPDAECFAVVDDAVDIYMQEAEYIVYENVQFLPTYDFRSAGNFDVLIKSGWLATLFDGGFDFYLGNGIGSVSYTTVGAGGVPVEAVTDDEGGVCIGSDDVDAILAGIIAADDYRELFISAETVGFCSGSDCAGIVIAGMINMSGGPADYAMALISDGEGLLICHSFGSDRAESLMIAEDFISAVTAYGEPVVYTASDVPELLFEQAVAPADEGAEKPTLNGREVTLPAGWVKQDIDIEDVDVFLHQESQVQAWLYCFDYLDEQDREMYGGNVMGGQDLIFDHLKAYAEAAFGFEDLDADGIEYSKGSVSDGRQCLRVKVPADGYILYAYVFYTPNEIAVMYAPCYPEDAEYYRPYMDEIAGLYFQ